MSDIALVFDEPNLLPEFPDLPRALRFFPESKWSASGRSLTQTHRESGTVELDAAIGAYLAATHETQTSWVSRFERELFALRKLERGWDSYDAPPPEAYAISMADTFLQLLWERTELVPSRVAPSVDGGVVVSFLTDDRRANLEFFGTGEVVAAISDFGQAPIVWEIGSAVDELEQAAYELGNHVSA